MGNLKKLNTLLSSDTKIAGKRYLAYGILGVITFPLFYVIWLFVDAQSYENPLLRSFCFVLCLFLLLHKQWPKRLKGLLPLYWYLALFITIPFFFSFMFFMNHASNIWIAANISSIFLILLLVDTFPAILLLCGGLLLGGLMAFYLSPFDWLKRFDYIGFFITYLLSTIIGIALIRNRQVIEKLKQETVNIKAEHQKERLEFLANINHDLRTPLSGLLSLSELEASKLREDDPYKKTFTIFHQSAKQLHQLFESILEIAKLGDAREPLHENTPFYIETLLHNLVELFEPALESKKLICHLDQLTPQPITPLIGYPSLIERVLINLVSNAIKFTDVGRVSLHYGLLATDPSSDSNARQLTLIVQDTGIGISQTDQAVIFDAFKRLTPAYKNNTYHGVGLGLHAVKKMVALMDGTIEVQSPGINQGSVFTCKIPVEICSETMLQTKGLTRPLTLTTFPLTICPSSQPQAPAEPPLSNAQSTHKGPKRILLVEDNRIAMIAAVSLLKRQTDIDTIDQAFAMQQAIEFACQHHYDLIIMDIGLPDGDGQMAARAIRCHEHSKNQKTLIVALTSNIDEKSKKPCLAATIDQIFYKPLCTEKLTQLLRFYQLNQLRHPTAHQ